ncbi:MAG: hypothetical protein ACD_71C00211G0001 [uncultured bacterium (gcode 4)]|uniref:Uncharacterized protein n=1 Tax=uncultured bacterium (gcode 4) TaxID=1234023 RepID=K2A2K8_9BACT|nr:MAG: hypothetical protein ACD_71C00211G0001 [uncultured bacterium (gcode 4)]
MNDIIPQHFSHAPGFKCLAIKTPYDREKTNFVLGHIRDSVMGKLALEYFHASVSNVIYDKILSTRNDVEGILLKDNKHLQDELLVISQLIIDKLLRNEEEMINGTIETKNIHAIKPTSFNPPEVIALIEKTRI